MAWRAHVWVDTTVGTISSSTVLGSLIYLNVLDDKRVNIKSLSLEDNIGLTAYLSIGLCIQK